MSDPLIQVRKHQYSGTLVLQRPDKRNALSRRLLDELEKKLHQLHRDHRMRAVILTGAGSTFCAGLDLGEMRETSEGDNADAQWQADARQFRQLLETMLRYPKPIIAAVNGPALGGGAGLALASDIVLASPTAEFGFPEPRRGLVAGTTAPLLFFRGGGAAASHLLLTSATITASEALRLGLYHEVVQSDLIWARAHQVAGDCARSAPGAISLTKRVLYETIGETLSTMMAAGAALSASARTTEAAQEGVAAFLEKRPAEWD